jgi:molecular chaperone GrpE
VCPGAWRYARDSTLRASAQDIEIMEPVESKNGIVEEDPQARPDGGSDFGPESGSEQRQAPTQSSADSTAERDRILREKAELQDLLLRRQAEFDNFRRRSDRERDDVRQFAAMDAVKALLPVVDDFERALKVETADREYARGMELIYSRLYEGLKKLGLEPISADPPLFNPHIHHAVEMVDTKDHPDQTILEEYQRGYYFKGRLLRPAMVKVAVNQ